MFTSMLLLSIFVGCTDLSRVDFLEDVIWKDNRKWWYRDQIVLNDKLQKMAADPYDFMRGTQRLHWLDSNRPNALQSSFLHDPEAAQVFIFGDPHPENWGIHLNNGDVALEMLDLDAAEYGPWHFDLRRLILGMSILGEGLKDCFCQEELVLAITQGYFEGLSEPLVLSGKIMEDLIEEAEEEGEERKRYHAKTNESDGEAYLLESMGEIPISVEQWAARKEVRVLDVGRRFAGVSSYSALRYLVLWDHGEAGADDDRLSQLRELSDPVVYNKKSFYSNLSRISFAQQTLWTSSHEIWGHDVWLAQGLEWKSLFYKSDIQDFDHNKLEDAWEEGDIDFSDIYVWSRLLGKALANRHALSRTRDGNYAQSIIISDIEAGGGISTLETELLNMNSSDVQQLYIDFDLFQTILEDTVWLGSSP